MSVITATAYREEAARFDLLEGDEWPVLATGTTNDLLSRTGADTLDAAFIALLPEEDRAKTVPWYPAADQNDDASDIAIEARGLTQRFADFAAADSAARILGEIFV